MQTLFGPNEGQRCFKPLRYLQQSWRFDGSLLLNTSDFRDASSAEQAGWWSAERGKGLVESQRGDVADVFYWQQLSKSGSATAALRLKHNFKSTPVSDKLLNLKVSSVQLVLIAAAGET